MSAVKPTAEDYEKAIAEIPEHFDFEKCSIAAAGGAIGAIDYIRQRAAELASHRQPETTFDPGELEWVANLLDLRDPIAGREREMASSALRAYAKLLRGEK